MLNKKNKKGEKSVYTSVYTKNMNKKAGLTDLFLFIIITVILIFISGIFIYIGLLTHDALHENMDDINLSSNVSEAIDNSFDELNTAYSTLYWVAILIIIAMILSIFIGNYLVTTRPIYFIPYIFIVIIAIVGSVGMSLAYSEVVENSPIELQDIFGNFIGSTIIIQYLPLWVAILGIGGGIVMFVRMGSGMTEQGYAQYG